jgi:GTP-binding protein HflX
LFFERPDSGELAVLVHVERSSENEREDPKEFEQLVISAGGDPAAYIMAQLSSPNPKYFIGTGKLEEIREQVHLHGAEVVIFNNALSPSQERNLEAEFQCRVLDRTGLILDIFAQRARTHEGKLQVELAQLQYVATRLVRGWTHLERQKGGIGLRGPGETQLETDRRLLGARITTIQKRLEKVHKQRQQGRRARMRADIPTVSLVGYTNAGKSTLFNRITQSEVYAADQLFATLDPTLRRLDVADIGPIVLADTVGFIRHLPHKLVEAFKATLETASEADLLLHVVDAPCDERAMNMEQVDHVLKEIGADEIPTLLVYNKVDLMPEMSPRIERDEAGLPVIVWLSAQSGAGMDLLVEAIAERLGGDMVHMDLPLEHKDARFRARLYAMSAVVNETLDDHGAITLEVRLPKKDLRRLMSQESMDLPAALVEKEDWQ